MRRTALFGTVMALVITLAVVVPVFGAPPAGIPPEHASQGHHRAPLLATGTTLTISGSGTAHKMILHIVVKNSASDTFRLILHGDHAKPSSSTAFNVDFQMPQSKLAHLWFLKFPGATATPK